MGFVNDGPIELDLTGFAGKDLSVGAWFGDTCTPEPVIADSSGGWLVPQKEPCLQPPDTSLGSVVRIKVAVTEPTLGPFSPLLVPESACDAASRAISGLLCGKKGEKATGPPFA